MTYNAGNDGHRYSGVGRGNLRVSLSSSRGARSISSDKEKQLDAESCFIAGLSLEDFPPIEPTATTSSRAIAAAAKLEHGGYGSDGIKVYLKNPHKYTGQGRGGATSRAGARSTLLRQKTLAAYADPDDDDEEEKKPTTGGYGSEGIKSSGPVVPRGGLQAVNQLSVAETGPKQEQSDLSSLDSDLGG